MANKSEIAQIGKLNLKKHRTIERKFIAEGKRLVLEGLKSNYNCNKLLISSDFKEKEPKLLESLHKCSNKFLFLSTKEFIKISSTKNPQGIAAVFEMPIQQFEQKLENVIIGLENISDPGNVGTILRSCDWFGVKNVLLSESCADIYNPKVLRASMGAVFNLRIEEEIDLITRLADLKKNNYKTYFADMSGIDYRTVSKSERMVITFCNEAFGPSGKLQDVCDNSITIPKKGNIDSLNVAAAAAVILAQLT